MDRKRPSADATAGSDRPDRKRRFSPPASSHASASNNGVSQMPGEEEEGEVDSLTAVVETFRKEAIYRQMLEYKRLHKRSSARVAELERRKHALEAGLEGVEVCWSELLATVRSLVGAKDLPDVSDPSRGTYPSSSSDLPKLSSEIDRRSQSTKQLLLKFVELAERGARASSEELRERYGTEHKKSATLRSSVNLLQSQLDLAREQQEKTQADLIRAEKKFDRLRCQTVQNVEDQQGTVPKKIPTNDMAVKAESSAQPSPTPVSNGHSNAPTPDPPTTAPTGPPIIVPDPETALLASSRLDEINKLREDRVRLETTLDALRTQVEHPSESVIAQSELFKQLLAQVSFFKAEASQAKAHFEKLAAEVDSLRDGRQDFEDSAINESRQEVDRLREQLGRKEADLARLRGQRDDLHGELGEAQAGSRDSLKYTIELVALSESKQERIASLVSEVGRLKTKLAASAGSESLLEFLLTEAGSDASVSNITSYIKSLETKLESSEARIASLAAQIAGFTSDASLSKALEGEAMARQALADVEVKLSSYERVFGPNASGEMAELAKKLEEKTKEVKRLELMVKENDSATDALYSEVERLSKAWEDVAARVESKVFHLRDAEEKVARLATEKAKADNKYFAAMRTKEAVDLERKTALRNVEKQVKVLEKLAESERSLTSQLALQEKEMTVLKTHVRNYQTKIQDLEREAAALQITRDSNRKQIAEMTKSVASRTQIAEKERANSMALSEELEATKRELAKVRSRADAVSGGGGGGGTVKEGELQEERNKLYSILRCSTCQLRLRTHCITVCMHTFCKECIDARVQTRQRKCPACNIGFAVSQVQQIYFQ